MAQWRCAGAGAVFVLVMAAGIVSIRQQQQQQQQRSSEEKQEDVIQSLLEYTRSADLLSTKFDKCCACTSKRRNALAGQAMDSETEDDEGLPILGVGPSTADAIVLHSVVSRTGIFAVDQLIARL
eukprot:753153-Hanusia_phi.AAC.1